MTTQRKRYGTPPIQFRLTAADLATIDAIKVSQQLESRADAVRFAVELAAKKLKINLEKSEK